MTVFKCVVRKTRHSDIDIEAEHPDAARAEILAMIEMASELCGGNVCWHCVSVTPKEREGPCDEESGAVCCPRCGERPRYFAQDCGYDVTCLGEHGGWQADVGQGLLASDAVMDWNRKIRGGAAFRAHDKWSQ